MNQTIAASSDRSIDMEQQLRALCQAGLSKEESAGLRRVREDLLRRQKALEQQGRLLQIGVMGQIKSGKSTFLNALLFGGREVLPRAATPKTAQLTRITYGEEPEMQITFCSKAEWETVRRMAEGPVSPEQEAALALLTLGEQRSEGADVIGAQPMVQRFDSPEQLERCMSDYVGEEGKYTPFVKAAQLRLCDPALKGLVIVDTPGLNDRIYFHARLTQEYMEQCDLVFFLSPASDFLDRTDAELLLAQLPSKGVGHLVLVASKYDSGLMDTIWDKGSLAAADRDTRLRLTRQAREVAGTFEQMAWREGPTHTLPEPLFLSVMAHNMAQKPVEAYDQEELRIWEGLSVPVPPTREQLEELSRFDRVRQVFLDAAAEKERFLSEKQQLALDSALVQWEKEIRRLQSLIEGRLRVLIKVQGREVLREKEQVQRLRSRLSGACSGCFDQLKQRLEQQAEQLDRELSHLGDRLFQPEEGGIALEERQGIRSKERTELVSASKWYKPWTWGKKKEQTVVYQEAYRYYDVAAAAEQLQRFLAENAQRASDRLAEAADWDGLREQLYNACLTALGEAETGLDPQQLRAIARDAAEGLRFPPLVLDLSELAEKLGEEFGLQADDGTMATLKKRLSHTAGEGLLSLRSAIRERSREAGRLSQRRRETLSRRLEQALDRELEWMEKKESQREREEQSLREILSLLEEAGK